MKRSHYKDDNKASLHNDHLEGATEYECNNTWTETSLELNIGSSFHGEDLQTKSKMFVHESTLILNLWRDIKLETKSTKEIYVRYHKSKSLSKLSLLSLDVR